MGRHWPIKLAYALHFFLDEPALSRCHMVFWPPWYINPGINFHDILTPGSILRPCILNLLMVNWVVIYNIMCVRDVEFDFVSTIFLSDFGTVQPLWYFCCCHYILRMMWLFDKWQGYIKVVILERGTGMWSFV
jgi:hypothetical protein